MAKKKQPYIPMYTGDYIKDTRSLSLAAKGAWSDLILYMWAGETRGVLEGTIEDFARMIGGSIEETEKVLLELCLKKICDRAEGPNGRFEIICRRLVREAQISDVRSESGSKGGSKTQANIKAKTKQKSDNDNEDDIAIENKKELREKNVPRATIDERITEALDDLYIDQQRPKWSHINFDFELFSFIEKVRGSPEHYAGHDTGGLRLAFQAQLRNAKKKTDASKNKHDRSQQNLNDVAIILQHASGGGDPGN